MAFEVKGKMGVLLAGGRMAAELSEWTLQRAGEGRQSITARLAKRDEYWLNSAKRFTLRLRIGRNGEWIWRNATITIVGDSVAIECEGGPECVNSKTVS